MKIAYLMNGVIGGLSGKNYESNDIDIRPEIVKYTANTHKYLKNSDDIEIDYFIFSWEPNLKEDYIRCYNPKHIECVPQIKFDMPSHYIEHKDNLRVQSHYSRWYGALHVLNSFLAYKNKNNISYDLVVNARLDLCFHNIIDFKSLDPNKFHIAKPINHPRYNWPNNNELVDHIFASSVDNMTSFLSLYNFLNEYTKPTECPQWKLISSHFLIVWHLRKLNLLNTDIINEAFSEIDQGFDFNTDYHIFRYEKLTYEQIKKQNDEL